MTNMGLNVVEKILADHVVEGTPGSGAEIGIRIDQTLTQDATGTMAYLQFEAMGFDRVKNELALSYVDHNTVQIGPENADDHRYLQSVAARYGVVFSKPGNGICHQLHLERFAAPGRTLLGADSHTPTAGGMGMLAVGAGGIDVAAAMGGGACYMADPQVVKIELTGSLKPWVSAKDVVLKVLEMFSTTGNVGSVFEYGGKGIKSLDVPQRATIANMGAECGVTSSIFPSDAQTKKFLEAQGRGEQWCEIVADADAQYVKTVKIDLSGLEPLAAAPHSPGNVVTVASLAGMKVDQVLIGSCTNSSYRDLKTVCKILTGRKVHQDVELGIAAGSRQVMLMLDREKYVGVLLEAGARLLENACGFCIGNSLSPATDAVSLRTSNRNFEGRSGTLSARVYIVSPEIAALAAVHGRIIDPSMIQDLEYPKTRLPLSFEIDDSMFVRPPEDGKAVQVVRGPSIMPPPVGEPLPPVVAGPVAITVGDKITTDDIMPAGQRLKYRSNIGQYAEFVFERIDPDFAKRAATTRDSGHHNIIVAGESYGQGSSREHAAICPMYLGVKAVIAKSIERIHMANLVNFGILPLILVKKGDYENLMAGDEIEIPKAAEALMGGGKREITVFNKTRQKEIRTSVDVSDRQAAILIAGGLLNHTRQAGK
jgi:aconitate hydratase